MIPAAAASSSANALSWATSSGAVAVAAEYGDLIVDVTGAQGILHQMQLRVAPGDRVAVCGVGCGGPMSPDGETVSPLNIAEWRAFPLRARLHELTGVPTHVDNDAKALALGEGWVGASKGRQNYLAMVVSTGVGGGIVLDGRLLAGESGNAGVLSGVGGSRCCLIASSVSDAPSKGSRPEISW